MSASPTSASASADLNAAMLAHRNTVQAAAAGSVPMQERGSVAPPPPPRESRNSGAGATGTGADEVKLEVFGGAVDFAHRDRSPEARAARRKVMLRAVAGEFVGTCLYLFSVGAGVVNLNRLGIDPAVASLGNAFVASLMLVPLAYSFCDVSGAHFNPAVTFATWLSGKTSNRKSALFVVAQITGGLLAMALVMLAFGNPTHSMDILTLTPASGVEDGRVFFIEFLLTFLLVFVIFTVAFESVEDRKRAVQKVKGSFNSRGLTLYTANPQSKTGLAPLIIGFAVFALNMFGGSISGGGFNPARVFCPAVFSGNFSRQWLYWIGELLGGAAAAGMSHAFHTYGVSAAPAEAAVKAVDRDAKRQSAALVNTTPAADATH